MVIPWLVFAIIGGFAAVCEFLAGFLVRGWLEARNRRSIRPYRYTWVCDYCDEQLILFSDNPSELAATVERTEARHRCGEPIV